MSRKSHELELNMSNQISMDRKLELGLHNLEKMCSTLESFHAVTGSAEKRHPGQVTGTSKDTHTHTYTFTHLPSRVLDWEETGKSGFCANMQTLQLLFISSTMCTLLLFDFPNHSNILLCYTNILYFQHCWKTVGRQRSDCLFWAWEANTDPALCVHGHEFLVNMIASSSVVC